MEFSVVNDEMTTPSYFCQFKTLNNIYATWCFWVIVFPKLELIKISNVQDTVKTLWLEPSGTQGFMHSKVLQNIHKNKTSSLRVRAKLLFQYL